MGYKNVYGNACIRIRCRSINNDPCKSIQTCNTIYEGGIILRNQHILISTINIKCPYQECGKDHYKTITVEYITNQRGDVIEHQIT